MKVGPSNQTMEKGHLPWSDFMVHGVNPALSFMKPTKYGASILNYGKLIKSNRVL
jgi:hypothetical protein